ncbi:universal stress protein [Leptodesmis sp.]|uniref:universal stress protein n=1 Tax=Leptodesmis sp. TaxID=3100501 RepID=UPI0040534620
MLNTDSRVLFPPLLLATDGSPSARLAQKMIRPLVHLFQAEEEGKLLKPEIKPEEDSGGEASSPTSRVVSILLMVLTVQPKVAKRMQRSVKKAASNSTPVKDKTETVPATEVSEEFSHSTSGLPPSLEELTASVQEDFPSLSRISVEVRQGRPTTEILNCARSIQAGLIAVGHRGGGVRELLLGSVSTAIARYAPCSVLITRSSRQSTHSPDLNHVLLVVDESVGTQAAIVATRQLIPAGIQTITLLHIQSPLNANYLLGSFFSPTPGWQLSQSLQNVQKEQGMQVLQRAIAALHCEDGQVTITPRFQTGDAGPLICQIAQELQVNLIILGNDFSRRTLLSPLQGRRSHPTTPDAESTARPIRNTRLSITDDYVIHYAPCPVLLCRSTQINPG